MNQSVELAASRINRQACLGVIKDSISRSLPNIQATARRYFDNDGQINEAEGRSLAGLMASATNTAFNAGRNSGVCPSGVSVTVGWKLKQEGSVPMPPVRWAGGSFAQNEGYGFG